MKIVIAGVLKKVLSPSFIQPPCPFRVKPIRCKGRLQELLDENGRHRQHHSGYMPEPGRNHINGQDFDKDPVPKLEAQCDYCLAHFWGRSLKTISNAHQLPQDIETWKNTREIKVMKRFCPKVFPPDQIQRAEEQARR